MYGLMHESKDEEIPLYGTIPRTGNSWTVKVKERKTTTGCTINGSIEGYGVFPFERYKGIPVIDFTGESFDRCFESLKLHDHYHPAQKESDLVPFIDEHIKRGFKVIPA